MERWEKDWSVPSILENNLPKWFDTLIDINHHLLVLKWMWIDWSIDTVLSTIWSRGKDCTCNTALRAQSRSFLWYAMLSSNFSSMLNPRRGLTRWKTSCNVQRESSSSVLQLRTLPSPARLSKGLETWKANAKDSEYMSALSMHAWTLHENK